MSEYNQKALEKKWQDKWQEMKIYQEKYFGEMSKGMRVYWGTAREFSVELRTRWERFKEESK